jgi:hypothetical protein
MTLPNQTQNRSEQSGFFGNETLVRDEFKGPRFQHKQPGDDKYLPG